MIFILKTKVKPQRHKPLGLWWEMVDTLRSAFFRTLASVTEKIAVLETSQSQKPIAAFGLLRLNHLRRFSSQYLIKAKEHTIKVCSFTWWEMVDSNHRRLSQQIYSLSPLATREISHIQLSTLELVDGLEPPTC